MKKKESAGAGVQEDRSQNEQRPAGVEAFQGPLEADGRPGGDPAGSGRGQRQTADSHS